ncbi:MULTISPECIES: OsmC family protein [Acinetobacter]|jgi:putative redox protein|uniref:OsmC family protein n=1 Tax=Acinetobacter TaxID=469 RepID=UPI00084BD65A|nr:MULTISPECIES: OsmC family protein [Acinetobacter]MBJ8484227.1 OsmC family protein [Acinetobacter vivianii]MEB6668518.1 OsmC family protein [Acinetobacter vivianii]OEC87755.1 osmotically inducible protein C [Acinetobacter sp. YK3]
MSIIASSKVLTLAEPWKGEVSSGTHQFLTDKPEQFGGHDTGPAPYDFLTASLASCTMITLRMYAQHKQIDLGEFTVEVDFHSNREQQERIERRVVFKQTVAQDLQEKLLNVCSKTPVTKTLLRSLDIHTMIL